MQILNSLLFAATVSALPQLAGHLKSGVGSRPISERANSLIPVVVGGNQLSFVPNSVVAALGDVIQFQFSNGNHTVTQSAENAPCQPLQANGTNGFYSGHLPFQTNQTMVGTFDVTITNTEPMFVYCSTGPHCQLGQVMVINPSSPQQLVDYMKLAAAATANVEGTTIAGGNLGAIPLSIAAFTPAQPQAAAPAPAPAAAPAHAAETTTAPPDALATLTPSST